MRFHMLGGVLSTSSAEMVVLWRNQNALENPDNQLFFPLKVEHVSVFSLFPRISEETRYRVEIKQMASTQTLPIVRNTFNAWTTDSLTCWNVQKTGFLIFVLLLASYQPKVVPRAAQKLDVNFNWRNRNKKKHLTDLRIRVAVSYCWCFILLFFFCCILSVYTFIELFKCPCVNRNQIYIV